jgi:alcohol dehydrogenase (cytochrome c)
VERWHVEISDFNQQYFSTMAPIIVDNHVLVGTGTILMPPDFFSPSIRDRQTPVEVLHRSHEPWRSRSRYMANLEAARHGGGQVWVPGSYDPETRLYIFGTGNPTPGYTGQGEPATIFSRVLWLPSTWIPAKMAWYFQTSVHDTHDWDSSQTPVLFDATINGRRGNSCRPRLAMDISTLSIA